MEFDDDLLIPLYSMFYDLLIEGKEFELFGKKERFYFFPLFFCFDMAINNYLCGISNQVCHFGCKNCLNRGISSKRL